MHRLYQKSKLWFSLIWIIVYVVGTSIADELSRHMGVEKSITLPFLSALTVTAILWMRQNRLFEEYGICMPQMQPMQLLFYIPLIVIASCNLWFGITLQYLPLETFLYVCSMLCVGFLEELIFRGFLFKAMCRDSTKSAMIVSSITFGIGHFVNLINGSGAQLIPNLCQVISAVAIGFLFVVLFYKSKSLWPCIITHGVLNALSAFAVQQSTASQTAVSAAVSFIAVLYALVLLKDPIAKAENTSKS